MLSDGVRLLCGKKSAHRELEYVKLGRSVRFKPETVQRLIDRGTVPALEDGKSFFC